MVEVTVEINISAPAQHVFQFIANPENNPVWQAGMKKCRLTNGKELRIGSTYDQEAQFMGKEIRTSFIITEFEKDHLIKGESVISTFPITFKRIVEGKENAHVKAIVTGAPKGLLGLLPFLTKWMIRSSIRKDYDKLKAHLEKQQNQ